MEADYHAAEMEHSQDSVIRETSGSAAANQNLSPITRSHIGKRLLVRMHGYPWDGTEIPHELLIMEFSPSGNYVKVFESPSTQMTNCTG